MKERNEMKKLISVMIILTLMTTIAFAEQGENWISALKNTIQVTLNGEAVAADNLLYEGRTYVQLREISNMIGADLSWDEITQTADLKLEQTQAPVNADTGTFKKIILNTYIDPLISYAELGTTQQALYGVAFEGASKDMRYALTSEGLQIYGSFSIGTEVDMILVQKDYGLIKRTLVGDDLPKVQRESDYQVIFVPADPSKGFNFPYMIRIPSENMVKYRTEKDYLMVDMLNNGNGHSLAQCIEDAKEQLSEMWYLSMQRSQEFGFPIMMPIVPRTGVPVDETDFGQSRLYEHALDRASVYVRELTQSGKFASRNMANYDYYEVDPTLYYDFDDQIKAMITHALDYLNTNNFGLEDKVIMDGYSASGTFTDRFTNLHPEIVKMVISGATLDDMMLPTDTYKGETLNFPVGTADFKAITGKAFDMEAHNKVARLIYMGKNDTNNTVDFLDCYFEGTQSQINKLFGNPVLPRALENIELYGKSGGHGLFILDQGIEHGTSYEMNQYINTFILANLKSDTPVYPPVNYTNLEATVFE